jgi:Dolichyl-phosphate-mannose-protein mannosyltransferase
MRFHGLRHYPVVAVAGLTLLGLALRIASFDEGLFGDELSTYWIVSDNSLGDVVSSVRSTDEITPPLFFVLGWLTTSLGDNPEWVRLPSLIAGTVSIPMIFLLGARTIGVRPGLIAAAVMALSPFMIYFSTEARAYALMIALVIGAALSLLAATRTGRTRWWVAYALCSLAALYTHYTCVFVLAAMALWVAWKHRERLGACVLANVGVAIGFAPWLPGFLDDNESPTTEILSVLSPFEFDDVRLAVEQWSLGFPYVAPAEVPGLAAAWLIVAGIAIAAIAGGVRLWQHAASSAASLTSRINAIPAGAALIILLAVSTPLGEAVVSAVGTNIFGARNLNASWPGLALAFGGILTAAGPLLGVVCTAAVLGGFTVGAARTLEEDTARTDYGGVATAIEDKWMPGDVVVDSFPFTPVPLTGLDAYLDQSNPEIRLGLPISDRPFQLGDPVPPLESQIREAIRLARGRSLFLVAVRPAISDSSAAAYAAALRAGSTDAGRLLEALPAGFQVEEPAQVFPGLTELVLLTITDTRRSS